MEARIRYTKMVIRDAFIGLLREKPLNKVTVTAICGIAQINRATFYKYYNDPFDLMKQIETELLLEVKHKVDQLTVEDISDVLRAMLIEVENNYEAYAALSSEHGDSQFINQVLMICYQSILPLLELYFTNLNSRQKEWLYYFMAQGHAAIIERWVTNGMEEPLEEVVDFMSKLNMLLLEDFNKTMS